MCSYSGAYEIATDLVVRLAQSEVFCVVLCRLLYLFWSFLTPPPMTVLVMLWFMSVNIRLVFLPLFITSIDTFVFGELLWYSYFQGTDIYFALSCLSSESQKWMGLFRVHSSVFDLTMLLPVHEVFNRHNIQINYTS